MNATEDPWNAHDLTILRWLERVPETNSQDAARNRWVLCADYHEPGGENRTKVKVSAHPKALPPYRPGCLEDRSG